jgi:hypothetical protein
MRYLILVLLLSSCVSTSQVMPYGKDTYAVTAADSGSGLNTSGDMKMRAIAAANDYCMKLGKRMRPVESSERGNTLVGASSALVFACD